MAIDECGPLSQCARTGHVDALHHGPGEKMTRDEAEHARICSLPYGHQGGHWWDAGQTPPLMMMDRNIRQWQEEAAELDAAAAQARAGGQGARFQIHAWEARAQALRDCASELRQQARRFWEHGP